MSSEGENAKKEEDEAREREPSGRFQTKAGLRRAGSFWFFPPKHTLARNQGPAATWFGGSTGFLRERSRGDLDCLYSD